MLRHLLQLCVPLTAVLCDAKLTPKQADRDMLLKDHQWKLAEQIVTLLEPFEDATTAISGQRYTTLSLMMPITCHLYIVMSAACNKPLSTPAKAVAKKLKSELVRKFPDACEPWPTSLPIVSAALDPRFRGLHFPDGEKAAAAAKEHVKSLVIERHTSATPQEIEPPAKKKPASAGGRGRLFWDRATPTPCKQAADSSLAAVDREVELYFTEGEVDVDDSRL